jgi:hypothetical protein
MARYIGFGLLLMAATACASTPRSRAPSSERMGVTETPPDSADPSRIRRQRLNPDRITLEEIRSSARLNAFELVRDLRPGWLHVRGLANLSEGEAVSVEIDGMPVGGVEALRDLPLSAIVALEFSDAFDARQRGAADVRHRGTIKVATHD